MPNTNRRWKYVPDGAGYKVIRIEDGAVLGRVEQEETSVLSFKAGRANGRREALRWFPYLPDGREASSTARYLLNYPGYPSRTGAAEALYRHAQPSEPPTS